MRPLLSTGMVTGVALLVRLPGLLAPGLYRMVEAMMLLTPSEIAAALPLLALLTARVPPPTTLIVLPSKASLARELTVPLLIWMMPALPPVGPKALAALALIVPPSIVVAPV